MHVIRHAIREQDRVQPVTRVCGQLLKAAEQLFVFARDDDRFKCVRQRVEGAKHAEHASHTERSRHEQQHGKRVRQRKLAAQGRAVGPFVKFRIHRNAAHGDFFLRHAAPDQIFPGFFARGPVFVGFLRHPRGMRAVVREQVRDFRFQQSSGLEQPHKLARKRVGAHDEIGVVALDDGQKPFRERRAQSAHGAASSLFAVGQAVAHPKGMGDVLRGKAVEVTAEKVNQPPEGPGGVLQRDLPALLLQFCFQRAGRAQMAAARQRV